MNDGRRLSPACSCTATLEGDSNIRMRPDTPAPLPLGMMKPAQHTEGQSPHAVGSSTGTAHGPLAPALSASDQTHPPACAADSCCFSRRSPPRPPPYSTGLSSRYNRAPPVRAEHSTGSGNTDRRRHALRSARCLPTGAGRWQPRTAVAHLALLHFPLTPHPFTPTP